MRLGSRSASAPERLRIRSSYLPEPALIFAGGREHVDQKTGLAVFGPASLGTKRHPKEIRIGFVGTGLTIGYAQQWFGAAAEGVQGDPENGLRDFPGCSADRGFFTDIVQDSSLVETISQHELSDVATPRLLRERFEVALKIVSDRVRLLSQRDDPPDYVVLALPDELLAHAQVVDYRDAQLGRVHRDFRRAIKAEVMRHRLPTQIVREATMQGNTGDHHSRVAWNLFTSLFYKGKGVPWRPSGLTPGTCYIGISFFRPLAAESGTLHTSIAQAFDENGTGLILRGPDFSWNEHEGGKSAHLDDERAHELMQLVLKRYKDETDQEPARVVVHKTSRFFPAEQAGFQAALKHIRKFDLVAINATDEVRLVRAGKYPPLRGTFFDVGLTQYLYTTGFIPALNAYPHGHVPSPLQIADHHGDGHAQQIGEEILQLTKMNWNSAGFAGAFPITIRFSRLVGDIMREVPKDREPEPAFKFYS